MSSPVSLPNAPRRRDDIETHLMPDGSALLYDPALAEGHALNITGSFIWEYCDGTLTPDEIAAELASVLPQYPEMHDEALRVIAEFAAMGLLAPERAPLETADSADPAPAAPAGREETT